MSPLTSIWHEKNISKYTNALGKESMKCLWCELDLGCAHSTRMINHLLKTHCAGNSSCAFTIPRHYKKHYNNLKKHSIESKQRKQKEREDELISIETHRNESVANVLASKKSNGVI